MAVVVVPKDITVEWVLEDFRDALLSTTERCPKDLPTVLSAATAVSILDQGAKLLKLEPTLLEIEPKDADDQFCIFGDTHGQFHDVCHMLKEVVVGPSTRVVFNGDYVDRGAWGVETLVLLVALKVAAPRRFFLLRGNHETRSCTHMYGFDGELHAKYGSAALEVAKSCRRVFAALPLAARIASATLVLHGGLFREPKAATPPAAKRARTKTRRHGGDPVLAVGTLQHLQAAGKGGVDPDGERAAVLVASDVLWSDPGPDPGLHLNLARGIGLVFGPDVTQEFMAANGLKLIIRSHEGPDARQHRPDMPSVHDGFCYDHIVTAGRLMTLFSAPDYPQFQLAGPRTNNRAAVVTLAAPDYCTPSVRQFTACPRPKAEPYYDFEDAPGSDEDMALLSTPPLSPSAGSPPPPPVPNSEAGSCTTDAR